MPGMVQMATALQTALVLVGGKALRMRPITEEIPKCMVEVAGKPLVFWILQWLRANGVKKVILGVDHKKEMVIDYAQQHDFGLSVVCNDLSGAEETGDAIRLAIERQGITDDVFLVMNGDELTDLSLKNFLTFHTMHKPVATLLSIPLRSSFGVITIDSENAVTEFREKPVIDGHFMNAGIYIFTQDIRPYLPERGSIEKTTFVQLAKERKLKAFKYFGFWATADTVKDIRVIEEHAGVLKAVHEA